MRSLLTLWITNNITAANKPTNTIPPTNIRIYTCIKPTMRLPISPSRTDAAAIITSFTC